MNPTSTVSSGRARRPLAGIVAAGFALCLVFLVGCAHGGPYRTYYEGQPSDPNHPPRKPNTEIHDAEGYSMGFVELDPQGWLWDADGRQLQEAQNLIVRASHLDDEAHCPRAIILVAYVHGWKHNADEDENGRGNVHSFRKLLARVAREENAESINRKAEARPVVGIYIGWPGLRADLEPFRTFSFYSRKNVGDRVGYLGGVTEVLSRLEKMHREINERGYHPLPDPGRSFFITVGHSFGAQVVFNALHGVMTDRLVAARVTAELTEIKKQKLRVNATTAQSKALLVQALARSLPTPKDEPVNPFGDMVILINPAFEAARYQNLKALAERLDYPSRQFPILAVFGSDTDTATHTFFPIGRFFSTVLQNYRTGVLRTHQIYANRHTIPWTKPLVTHRLEPFHQQKHCGSPFIEIGIGIDPAPWNETTRDQNLKIGDSILVKQIDGNSAGKWTPLYVTRVDRRILDKHGGLWEDERENETPFANFLSYFIALPLFTKS